MEISLMTREHSKIQRGISFIEKFSQYDGKMQMMTALTLLYVARHQDRDGGVTTNDLQRWIGIHSSSASRNTYYWGDGTADMPNAGFNMMRIDIDPADRRRRLIRLTPRGEAFVAQLEEILYG